MEELEVLNRLCKELGESMDPATRARAEQNLAELVDSPQCLRRCMLLLERGDVCERLDLAIRPSGRQQHSHEAAELENWYSRRTEARIEQIYSDLLGTRSASLPPFIVSSLCQLFARITKQEWTYTDNNDQHIFHAPISDLIATIDINGGSQSMLALQLLSTLLNDFNSQAGMESVNKHRKGIALFRDSHIFEIFETSVSLLEAISRKDLASLQILHIGVQLASVRRTLFNGSERQTYLEHVVAGVKRVIENPEKLTEQPAFHEFCRMVSRLKTNFQLCELIKVPDYAAVMRLLAQFTVESLRMMDLSANSTYFLLTFWQRMVTSVPYVRSSEDHLLNLCCPEIMTAFVRARLQNVERVACMVVTLIGTAVFGKTAVSNNEEHDKMDGDLVARWGFFSLLAQMSNSELSLSLLKDLSLGYTAVRKLFRLQEVQLLLSNHTHVTRFSRGLTRLLTIDLNDDEQLFEQFMQPLAGNRILVMPDVPKERAYAERYKNIGIIFNVLKCALIGAYVPFGVFRLYGDPCLQDSLNMFVKLFMKIPEEDFHSYTKIAQHYYNLLENVVQDNIAFVSNLQPEVFAAILRSVHTGVTSLDAVVITSACSALDTILNYLYKSNDFGDAVICNVAFHDHDLDIEFLFEFRIGEPNFSYP
ncbi:hypothetical protein OSTOST_25931 [Ostertagia ostertagi]